MTIKEGIKIKGKGVEIPDAGRRQLPRFFRDMGYKIGVEVGVQRGSFTRRLCKEGLTVHGVDPWLDYSDYYESGDHQEHQNRVYEVAKKNLSEFPNCTLIRKTSMEAVKDFADESIDFVYIDGNHGFKYVTEDIFNWSKKVKKGGCISGHDYAYDKRKIKLNYPYVMQVKYVIDAYTKAFNIENWWVIGRKHKKFEGEKRDQYRSWMWFRDN